MDLGLVSVDFISINSQKKKWSLYFEKKKKKVVGLEHF